MKRGLLALLAILILFFFSLFPTWNFSKRIAIPVESNPFWTENKKVINSPLTEALRQQGYTFQTGRGAEADPDGICFGRFGSDEHWVVLYHSDRQVAGAYAWIIGLNWMGHLSASLRFRKLEHILKSHLE